MSTSRYVRTPGGADVVLEVGKLSFGDYAIRVSNFKRRTIVVTEDQLRAFFEAVKNGHFDRLLEVPK